MAWLSHQIRHYDDPPRPVTPTVSRTAVFPDNSSPGSSFIDFDDECSPRSRSPQAARRKRLSFFSRKRSSSIPTLHSAVSSQQDSGIPSSRIPQHTRPPSAQRVGNRRRAGDTIENIRNSIFRARRGEMPSSPESNSPAANLSPVPFLPNPSAVKVENEKREHDYQYRTKSSISPPFNFQHITHTAKKSLPKLDTVDEKDLPARFWAVNAYQRPRHKLNGIKADPLELHRSMSLSASHSARNPVTKDARVRTSHASHTGNPSVDETTFDETSDTRFVPDEAFHLPNDMDVLRTGPCRPPKHYSSMGTLNAPSSTTREDRTLGDQRSLDESKLLRQSEADMKAVHSGSSQPTESTSSKDLESASDLLSSDRQQGQIDGRDRPLPTLPTVPHTEDSGDLQTKSAARLSYSLFPAPPTARTPPAVTPLKLKRSSRSAATIASLRSVSSFRSDILEEDWEDDVTFAYEQEAEGRCDFNWEAASTPRIEEDEGASCAGSSSTDGPAADACARAVVSHCPAMRSKSSLSNVSPSAGWTVAADSSTSHRRGSSVGHKGFAAARNASQESGLRSSPVLSSRLLGSAAETPPPRIIHAGSESDSKSQASLGLHFPSFDVIVEYLSDPESTAPGGAKHRTSSSFGSYESSGRSLKTASDTGRWSSASTSSIPDLLYNKRKSRASVHKGKISRPLESVPHSPKPSPLQHAEDKLDVPRPTTVARAAETDFLIIRRPETPADREILYTAGRTVQRGRSATPNRLHAGIDPDRSPQGGWI